MSGRGVRSHTRKKMYPTTERGFLWELFQWWKDSYRKGNHPEVLNLLCIIIYKSMIPWTDLRTSLSIVVTVSGVLWGTDAPIQMRACNVTSVVQDKSQHGRASVGLYISFLNVKWCQAWISWYYVRWAIGEHGGDNYLEGVAGNLVSLYNQVFRVSSSEIIAISEAILLITAMGCQALRWSCNYGEGPHSRFVGHLSKSRYG